MNSASIIRCLLLLSLFGCELEVKKPKPPTPKVSKNIDGSSLEQDNIRAYREIFSDPRAMKHLYVFNDQGDCIFYDTVRGKVTSGGKRLRPKTVTIGDRYRDALPVSIEGKNYRTTEVPAFDGTYGSSESYIYWRNAAGQFRKLSIGAGMATLITTAPARGIKAKVEIVTTIEAESDK